MSVYFKVFEEPYTNIYGSRKAMRVAGDFAGDNPASWRVYASMTEVRSDYADTTLAWCYTQEEYEQECAKALALLEKYQAEAEK